MSTAPTRTRGRPRSFDEEAVLDALTMLFWRQGYEATSITDIAETAGLNRSSLYNAFGSKEELFWRIVDRYIADRAEMLDAMVDENGSGLDAVHAFVELLREETRTEGGRHGCLAVAASSELGTSGDPTAARMSEKYRAELSDRVRRLIHAAADSGEIDPRHVGAYADMLMVFMLGLSVIVRSGAGDDETARLIDSAHTTVESWRN